MLVGATSGFSAAFVAPTQRSSSSSSTVLYANEITTRYKVEAKYGIEGAPMEEEKPKDPAENVQAYIEAPESVAAKKNLDGGAVLVSGWVNTRERTDQTVFDLLNHEESAMKFDRIVAFVDDVKFARKRLLSRSARYTGLLDKLDFVGASEPSALPTVEQLEGVTHWVVNVENGDLERVEAVAALCAAAPDTLENVSVLLTGAASLDVSKSNAAVKSLSASGKTFSVVAVGDIKETAEGSMPYDIENFGTEGGVVPEGATYSRDEGLRLVTECLQLESGTNKALTFTECTSTNTTENIAARLVKGLREAGYTRPQEIDHMIAKGVKGYQEAIDRFAAEKEAKENPDPEILAQQQAEREKEYALTEEKEEREAAEREKKEIEKQAKDWARREYIRRSIGGGVGMTQEEFTKKHWEEAMFEGDLMYRMTHGGSTDSRTERSEFEEKMEKKKQAAMKKAREALEGKLGDLIDNDDDDDDDDE